MSHTLNTLENSRIIVLTENSDFNSHLEISQVVRNITAMLDDAAHPVVCVFDARAHNATNLAVGTLVRTEEGRALICHPKLLKLVAVTNNRMAQLELKGINSATFGFVEIGIFSIIEDAMLYAQHLIHTHGKVRQTARLASGVKV